MKKKNQEEEIECKQIDGYLKKKRRIDRRGAVPCFYEKKKLLLI